MWSFFFSLCIFVAAASLEEQVQQLSSNVQNQYPVVLVHGLFGFDELLGIPYWGGLSGNYAKKLESLGYEVYVVSIGPVSSNWDRACELYAQIKGGTVDYGEAHSNHHGHSRFGRTYPGLYPEWGELDASGNVNKVHLIGHSLGGQTIRVLAQLLKHGTTGAPIEEDKAENQLFVGNHDWVHSITTISTPNGGAFLGDAVDIVGDQLISLLTGLFAILNIGGDFMQDIFDIGLDQWGLAPKQSGESITAYLKRVFASPMFQPGFQDISLYDCAMKGAGELNQWVRTDPDIYYYSYSTQDTYKTTKLHDWKFVPIHKPHLLSMLLPMQPISLIIGGTFVTHQCAADPKWQGNDGIVNTYGMQGNMLDDVVVYNGQSKTGRWHHLPLVDRTDHMAIIGWTLIHDVENVYVNHMGLLASLPIKSTARKESLDPTYAQLTDGIATVVKKMSAINTDADVEALCAQSQLTEHQQSYCEYLSSQRRLLRH